MNAPKPKFVPTAQMIEAAETVFLTMVIADHVRPIVEAYEAKILHDAHWPIARKWVELGLEDRVILQRKDIFLLEDEHASVFYGRCHEARKAADLKVSREDNCPLLEAENHQRIAERALLTSMEPVTKLTADQVTSLPTEKYRQLIDLTLRLLAPHVKNPLAPKGGQG